MVAVMTLCPCGGNGWDYAWPDNSCFCMYSHEGHTLVHWVKDGEDMLVEGG